VEESFTASEVCNWDSVCGTTRYSRAAVIDFNFSEGLPVSMMVGWRAE
jgi:hypothetical protein